MLADIEVGGKSDTPTPRAAKDGVAVENASTLPS
jgi:hypothetical protein